MDKIVPFLPLGRAVELIFNEFCRNQKQTLKDLLWTIRDLVQFTLCPPIHGKIVTIIPKMRLLRVNILIIIQMRKATVGKDIITLTEVEDKDKDRNVDEVLIMFLTCPIHLQHYTFNKLVQMFLWMQCPQ